MKHNKVLTVDGIIKEAERAEMTDNSETIVCS